MLPGWVEDPQTHAPIGKRTYNGPASGPTAKAQGQQTRLSDYFEMVMPTTLAKVIATYANYYAATQPVRVVFETRGRRKTFASCDADHPEARCRYAKNKAGLCFAEMRDKWMQKHQIVSQHVILVYATLICMSALGRDSIAEVWTTYDNGSNSDKVISGVITRDAFKCILWSLQYVPNVSLQRHDDGKLVDPIARVRWLIEEIEKNLRTLWTTGCEVALDEWDTRSALCLLWYRSIQSLQAPETSHSMDNDSRWEVELPYIVYDPHQRRTSITFITCCKQTHTWLMD